MNNNNGEKIVCDKEDVLSTFHQTQDLVSNFIEKHFDELFTNIHGNAVYRGQLEKNVVIEEMDKWVETAFQSVVNNTQGHNLTSFFTDPIDDELDDDIEERRIQMEDEMENLIKKRKQVAESMNRFIKLSLADQSSVLDRVEFVEEEEEDEEEEEEKEKGPALPTLKRPLEQVKKDYKESYESIGQLCEELESTRTQLEEYQKLANQLMNK